MLIRGLYTVFLTLTAPFLVWKLYRHRDGKPSVGSRWKEHFGITPPLKATSQPIWIHAVSVGETIAVSPLVRKLKQQHPDTPILITTTTATGAEQAAKLSDVAEHRYMPFDFPFALKRFIKTINPSQLLIMETELWPNTLFCVAQANIPISIINARLSERSCQRYANVRALFTTLANNLHQILCQYPSDAERFIRLGVPPEKVKVTGSIKFDIEISPSTIEQGNQLRQQLGYARPIWIAASTHKGEDEQILAAHKAVLKSYPEALLILVPRHPERFNEVFELCLQSFKTQCRTSVQSSLLDKETQIFLGDTMGEMLILLQATDICFMGGSLLGDKVGGHNVLEPAALGKAILTGPSYFNFKEIVQELVQNDGCIIVNAKELARQVITLIDEKDIRTTLGINAIETVIKNRASIQKTLLEIENVKKNQ
ncbi:lipid IV(A) 3-deoxy-D-manno-octulosonic acid transferase [Vibrio paracholerae]|uniref:3-deoxy-D-manno-octulosonic acid transferase n=1 Tax=Vibrio paracholerae TaxID=650003 RepID=A0ABD7FXY4_9VIBR|nr:lipid IV(A) 3-deoxy-D-manno-octulosonic acid transferase [Vibrio paracholerae]RBM71274.1 3-deoxy-D-manno-octulosonic acid transferase [Vibrio paracholerae]